MLDVMLAVWLGEMCWLGVPDDVSLGLRDPLRVPDILIVPEAEGDRLRVRVPLEDRVPVCDFVMVRVSDWLVVPLPVPVSEAVPVTLGDAETLWDGVSVMLRERLCERVLVCERDTERLCVCVRVKVRACVRVALGVAAALWLWLADWDAEFDAVPLCDPEREDEGDAVPDRLDVRDALCVAVKLAVSDELALCEMDCVTLGLRLRVPETLAVPDWDSSVPDGLPV